MVDFELTQDQERYLLSLARSSIQHGLEHGTPLNPGKVVDSILDQPGACFVTLTIGGDLRGCIGSLQARRSLPLDVCENAFSSAFHDTRFTPLRKSEFDTLHIEISVLTPLVEMQFESEDDLLDQIVPFEDGLVLEEGHHRGTFLPLVWEKLPDKGSFLAQLKLKAGLSPRYWSDSIKIFRYHTLVFEE